jgi:hypothetical protein
VSVPPRGLPFAQRARIPHAVFVGGGRPDVAKRVGRHIRRRCFLTAAWQARRLSPRSANILTYSWTQHLAGCQRWPRCVVWPVAAFPSAKQGGTPDYLAAVFTPQRLASRQCSAANAAPASRPRPIPACRPVASPLPRRYLSVAPLQTLERGGGEVTAGEGGSYGAASGNRPGAAGGGGVGGRALSRNETLRREGSCQVIRSAPLLGGRRCCDGPDHASGPPLAASQTLGP